MTVAAFTAALLENRLPPPLDSGIRLVFLVGGLIIVVTGLTTLWVVREVLPRRKAKSGS